MKRAMKALAWLLIIWGFLGITANGSALYLSMTNELKPNVSISPEALTSDSTSLFLVIISHLFLIIAGFAIKKKSSASPDSHS